MRIELPPRRRNSILLTSVVDVMFTLLFFFMLTSSYLDWRSVSLSLAGRGSEPAAGTVWAVQLLPAGELRLNGAPLAPADLRARLRVTPDVKLILQPAPGVPLQDLVSLFDLLQGSGAALSLGRFAGAP